jgi:hypothetical protein
MLKTSMTGPLGGDARSLGAPTTYVEDVDGRTPAPPPPAGVRLPTMIQKCTVTYIGSIDRSNFAHGSHSTGT